MVVETDLVVVGAGPAGTSAALAAANAGLGVILIDEAREAGGQVYRAPARTLTAAIKTRDRDAAAGVRLRAALDRSSVRFERGLRVWSIGERFRTDTVGPEGVRTFKAPRLIAAGGAFERTVPFPGWTLPGVMGLAAATILLKSEAMLPGRRVVIAGCGPLLAAVAAKVSGGGGDVAAVIDMASRRQWASVMLQLATRFNLLREGAGWVLGLARRRVPIHFASTIRRIDEADGLLSVEIGPVDGKGRARPGRSSLINDVDAVAVGHGLVPGVEITRLAGAAHTYDRLRGGWVPVLDAMGRTTIEGLYAAGDGCGIRGALSAATAGTLAGLAAAGDAGALDPDTLASKSEPQLKEAVRLDRFSAAVSELLALRPGQVADIAPDTVVCRCEDVRRADIDAAIADGAADVNQLKHFTRCGMGPCQGRMCGDVVGELVALHAGSREAAGAWTPRPPLRPVPLADLIGSYSYNDMPIPKPVPL